MPTYVTLYKWTDQGIKGVKEAPGRIEDSIQTAARLGGKVLAVYVTLGEYDLVGISEWPSDEAATTAALAIASRGNVTTQTMRAFTSAEFAELVKKLP